MTSHFVLEKKVRLYQRPRSAIWQCSCRLNGYEYRRSSGERELERAKKVATDWYFDLRQGDTGAITKAKDEPALDIKTFAYAAAQFLSEYDVLTEGERNPRYTRDHAARLTNHLLPFFGKLDVKKVTAGKIQNYRVKRLTPLEGKRTPSRSTIHHEIVTLRHVMKTALRHGWIDKLPDFSTPYGASKKVSHRAWFTKDEYKKLYTATRERVKKAEGQWYESAAKQLHDYILIMANTGLRPDEANRLEYRDVEIVEDEDTGQTILLIEVRGKRGVGFCKSMPGAVFPFQRIRKRNKPKPNDLVFPQDHKKQFNAVLEETGLKKDRDGNSRTSYSLRHTYICLRLLEGADIYQVAKNCRTSVEMIEKHYAVHLKNTINAADINVKRRSNPRRQQFPEQDEVNA